MSPPDLEYSTKADAPTERDRLRLQLLANWYQRQANSFIGRDPLSRRERQSVERRRGVAMEDARIFLTVREAERRAEKEREIRAGLRILTGGRQ